MYSVHCTCTPYSAYTAVNIKSIRPKRALSRKRMPKQCEIIAIIKSQNVEWKEKTCQNWWFAKYIDISFFFSVVRTEIQKQKFVFPKLITRPFIKRPTNGISIFEPSNILWVKWSDKNKIIIKCSNHCNMRIIFQAPDRSTRLTSIKRPYTFFRSCNSMISAPIFNHFFDENQWLRRKLNQQISVGCSRAFGAWR